MLKGLGAGALALGTSGVLDLSLSRLATAATKAPVGTGSTIRIGYVSPQTGSLAGFSLADSFVLKKVRGSSVFTKGLTIGGKKYSIEILTVDSQSDPNRASQVAQNLILANKVDLVVTSSAPETTNPVSEACEQLHVPSLSTVVPWEAWYAGLGGNPLSPTKTFEYSTMFFFGIPQFASCFEAMWNRVRATTGASKVFAGVFPNDSDGNAFRAAFPPSVKPGGYKFIDGGAYTDGTTNYSSMIEKFKAAGADFFVNCPLPPDFNTFWKQAAQEGFKPKLATVAKVLLFPADVAALGSLANNIATDAWWTPFAPYHSSLTGESAKQFAIDYETSSGNEWIQSMGSTYSLFEVAVEALRAVDDPHDRAQLASALHKVNYTGITGPINFAKGPAPGVGLVNPVGIQWKPGVSTYGKTFPWEAFVVDNTLNKDVPINGDLKPTFA